METFLLTTVSIYNEITRNAYIFLLVTKFL